MKHTAIRCVFNLNAALKKFNGSGHGFRLTQKDLYLLYAIGMVSKHKSVTRNELFLLLNRHGRTTNQALLMVKLSTFVEAGLINITATRPTKYGLSLTGGNYLNTIEKLIKKRSPIVLNRNRSQPKYNRRKKSKTKH